jgi:hypothetical protein
MVEVNHGGKTLELIMTEKCFIAQALGASGQLPKSKV